MPTCQTALQEPGTSVHLMPRPASHLGGGGGTGPKSGVKALTNQELTQAFLLHDEQLALVQLQTSLVYKLPAGQPLSQMLLKFVQAWQAEHKQGKAHPFGAIHHYVAGALLFELSKSKQIPPGIDSGALKDFEKWVSDLGPEPHAFLSTHVAYCSARLSAKKDHLILDYRPVLHSPLAKYVSLMAALLDSYEGERLGKKAPGSLARKARGKPQSMR